MGIGTLAGILKYDQKLEPTRDAEGNPMVSKGYYEEEEPIVLEIKRRLGVDPSEKLYTVECQIMESACEAPRIGVSHSSSSRSRWRRANAPATIAASAASPP